jgi:hypothetical protein
MDPPVGPLTSTPGRADTGRRTTPKGISVLELNAGPNLGDRHPWRAAVAIGLLTIAAGMAYSLWLAPWVRASGWWIPDDSWVNLTAAHRVAGGGFASVYQASPLLVVVPLYPVLLVPLAMMGSHWHLAEGVTVRHPSMWLLYGPVVAGTGILVLHAARTLLRAAGARFRLGRVEWALVPVTLFPVGVVFGHGEDLLALGLVMWGVAAHLRRRPIWAAILFGAAIASKQWAVLGLPLLVTTSPRERRGQILGVALGIPLALVLLPLVTDWSHASKALLGARSFPGAGHRAVWLRTSGATIVATPFRLGVFVAAGLVAWRLRGEQPAARLIAGYALIFTARILFEPVVFSYYLAPGLAFLVLHERLAERTVRRTMVVGTALLLCCSLYPPLVVWWLGALAMVSILVASAAADVFGLARFAGVPGGAVVIPFRDRVSWPRSIAGSRSFPRTDASPARRDTTAPARVRS